ncbi:hypothetical protein ACQY0O_005434 [Thecaphora frezii]
MLHSSNSTTGRALTIHPSSSSLLSSIHPSKPLFCLTHTHSFHLSLAPRLPQNKIHCNHYLADVLKENKTETDKRFVRAEAANANGFENLGFFAAAVVAGNIAGLPPHELNALTFGYLVSRVVYNYFYITVKDEAAVPLRSGSYLAGIGIIFTLFIRAGNKVV